MRTILPIAATLLITACGARVPGAETERGFQLPDSIVVRDGSTGARINANQLRQRLSETDLVLLGEVHDNGIQHGIRGQLLTALAARRPAIVFEQFAEAEGPIPPPAADAPMERWLDERGFDRTSWKWPLHRPVVQAALEHGRSLWGTGLSREALRSVVREGESAAPAHLRTILARAPLDTVARAKFNHELFVGHCGQLPTEMMPGMRAAQVARDASMARALASASTSGPAVLIAGNGHVRRDIAVPRLLRVTAPDKSVLAVGFLERTETGAEPEPAERAQFDLVVITPRVAREDPCAEFRRQSARLVPYELSALDPAESTLAVTARE
ncbi:MAG: ChaN family lipoprotein [Gemmatimonadota bacterium]